MSERHTQRTSGIESDRECAETIGFDSLATRSCDRVSDVAARLARTSLLAACTSIRHAVHAAFFNPNSFYTSAKD